MITNIFLVSVAVRLDSFHICMQAQRGDGVRGIRIYVCDLSLGVAVDVAYFSARPLFISAQNLSFISIMFEW